ncbi:MAG: carboxypeptidase-like regulatory domain-containing protein [Terracidiphilus sp.]
MIKRSTLCAIMLSATLVMTANAQQETAPKVQGAIITGTVTDLNGDALPGASVTLKNDSAPGERSAESGNDGSYAFDRLMPGVYRVTIDAGGFVLWTSGAIALTPGQSYFVTGSKLRLASDVASVTVYASSDEIAEEQVRTEERQRAFGIFPNFYVVYNRDAAPLTKKLKFKLALKASTDPTIFAAVGFAAGLEQAANTPDYGQGAKGYGQRMGALYTNAFTDIMIGEAILPSLLHQDPRYFYQGTGTRRSRTFHALSNAFISKGDNGKLQPNYSNIGGDLLSGAISNIYYPKSNRGVGIVFENALISAGGRMANGIVQEFILRRFTSGANRRTP